MSIIEQITQRLDEMEKRANAPAAGACDGWRVMQLIAGDNARGDLPATVAALRVAAAMLYRLAYASGSTPADAESAITRITELLKAEPKQEEPK